MVGCSFSAMVFEVFSPNAKIYGARQSHRKGSLHEKRRNDHIAFNMKSIQSNRKVVGMSNQRLSNI